MDNLDDRYNYFKKTGAYLSQTEIFYYKRSNIKRSEELIIFIKNSEEILTKELTIELNAIEEAEATAKQLELEKVSALNAKQQAELAMKKVNSTQADLIIAKEDAEKQRDLAKQQTLIAEKEKLAAEIIKEKVEEVNAKLALENKGSREFRLHFETVKATHRLKLTSLILVLLFVFIPMMTMLYMDYMGESVSDNLMTAFTGITGTLIGAFLISFSTSKI